MRKLVIALGFAAGCVLAACGGSATDPGGDGGGGGGGGGGGASSVVVGNNSFSPSGLTVPKGTTVTWTWDQYSTNHNVKFDDGPASETMSSGQYTRTFSATGAYPYHCEVHGQSMSGTITVK